MEKLLMLWGKKKKKKPNRESHESLRDYTAEDAIVVVEKAVQAFKLETINSTLSLADCYLEEAQSLTSSSDSCLEVLGSLPLV